MWFRLAFTVALLSLAGVDAVETHAQTSFLVPPAPTAAEADRVAVREAPRLPVSGVTPEYGVDASRVATVPCQLNCGYWVVSTRRCPQYGQGTGVCCGFDFFYSPGDGSLYRASREQFYASLDPSAPACVVVHGSFVEWEDIMHESFQTYRWLRRPAGNLPANMIFFTWPSEGPFIGIPQVDVGLLGRRGGFTGLYLAQFISELSAVQRVSLLGHSHGARVVSSALHVLGGGCVQGYRLGGNLPQPHRIRAVLAAAAIDHHWLTPGERYGRALCRVECLVNLRNHLDIALAIYPLRKLFSHRALARTGFTGSDRRRLGSLGGKVHEIDVSGLVGTGHMWPNYYEHTEIACVLVPYLFFSDDVQAYLPTAPAQP